MRRDTIPNLALCVGVFVMPLVPVAARLWHPAPWIGCATMFATLQTQPAIDRSELVSREATDRRSALAIFLAVLATQLVAIGEYGYAPWSAREVGVRFAAGVTCAAAGLAIRVWSIRTLGAFFTATVRVQQAHVVVTTGPYRWVRHPSYSGAVLIAIGVATTLGAPIACALAVVVAVPAYLYRIRVEEAALGRALGASYDDYAARTRRLIPWIY